MGGHNFQNVFGCTPQSLSTDVLKEMALDVLRTRLGITVEPTVCLVLCYA